MLVDLVVGRIVRGLGMDTSCGRIVHVVEYAGPADVLLLLSLLLLLFLFLFFNFRWLLSLNSHNFCGGINVGQLLIP